MSKVIIKVEYKEVKFKFALTDSTLTFNDIKIKLLEKLEQQGIKLDSQNTDLSDASGFIYIGGDNASDYLQNDDTVKITEKLKVISNDQLQQQAQDHHLQ